MNILGLRVESLEKPMHVSSSLGIRVRIDKLCRDCELEIYRILLMMDLRIVDMSDLDVILNMEWIDGPSGCQ